MKLFNVTNKSVLITGASRGIGLALAKAFVESGAIVYGAGSRPESVEGLSKLGINPLVIDVRQPGTMEEEIQKIKDKNGKLDCLINNAGIATNTTASHFTEEEMNNIIQINYAGLFRNCQAYYRVHKKMGGNIINIASVLGLVGTKLASVYSGTKGAVISLTKALAYEWCNSSYRINAICPGLIDTDMTDMIKKRESVLNQINSSIPLGRLGRPEEIAGAAIYLASDASSYVTGSIIVIDGGLTAI